MDQILTRALSDTEHGLGSSHFTLTPEARELLIHYGDGDARSMLTALEFLVAQLASEKGEPVTCDDVQVKKALLHKSLRYDKEGEEHYNLISAYIKSMRDSDPDAALYWLARMLEGGEDPKFIARRLVIFASEDVGNADPQGLVLAISVFQAVEKVGLPEAQINLAQGTTYLATAPKSNASYVGLQEAIRDSRDCGSLPVPLHLRNAVTTFMKDLDYGKGYRYAHEDPHGAQDQLHFPKELENRRYYRPGIDQTRSRHSQDDQKSGAKEGNSDERKKE